MEPADEDSLMMTFSRTISLMKVFSQKVHAYLKGPCDGGEVSKAQQ
ncbi:MAG: hypothetical protein AAFZ17_20475 [Cyanobacteria bacterium J06650_10]